MTGSSWNSTGKRYKHAERTLFVPALGNTVRVQVTLLHGARNIIRVQTNALTQRSNGAAVGRKRTRGYTLPSKPQRELGYEQLVTDMITASIGSAPVESVLSLANTKDDFLTNGPGLSKPGEYDPSLRNRSVKADLDMLKMKQMGQGMMDITHGLPQRLSWDASIPVLASPCGAQRRASFAEAGTELLVAATDLELQEALAEDCSLRQALAGKGPLDRTRPSTPSTTSRRQSFELATSLGLLSRRNSRSVSILGVEGGDDSDNPTYVQAMIKPQIPMGTLRRSTSLVELSASNKDFGTTIEDYQTLTRAGSMVLGYNSNVDLRAMPSSPEPSSPLMFGIAATHTPSPYQSPLPHRRCSFPDSTVNGFGEDYRSPQHSALWLGPSACFEYPPSSPANSVRSSRQPHQREALTAHAKLVTQALLHPMKNKLLGQRYRKIKALLRAAAIQRSRQSAV